MGIGTDGGIHVSDEVIATHDGPMFNYGLKRLEGANIRLPNFEGHHPKKEFLAQKFDQFLRASR